MLKCHGKTLWGVRIFDGAKSAEERRGHRTSRRRTEHQHQRIIWLQEIFSDKINNYPAYSGKDSLNHKCGYDDFCKYLKNKIKPYIDKNELLKEIYDELELGTFLPKQVSKNNAVIPYQLNEAELLKILSNA